ncbi:MAG: NAD(P)H-hydrate epimerase [Planctomycetota bacterium]
MAAERTDPAEETDRATPLAYTAEEALAMDRWLIEERGFTLAGLMGAAGARLAEAVRDLVAEYALARVVLLAGPGHNGGDARVAEALLRNGRPAVPTTLWQPLSEGSGAEAAPDALGSPSLDGTTLLVDGLFGVGLCRPLTGAALQAVEHVNAARAARLLVLAVDIPSGLHATTGEVLGAAIQADHTLCFVGPKRGFFVGAGPRCVGRWRAVEIGFPAAQAEAWVLARRAAAGGNAPPSAR